MQGDVQQSPAPSLVFGYGIAIAGACAAALLQFALRRWLNVEIAYPLFAVAIVAAAAIGGTWPAIVALLLSAICGVVFGPFSLVAATGVIEASLFLISGAGIILLVARSELRRRHLSSPLVDELNLLIDGAQDYAIYMLDAAGYVTIWNKGAERLKGWSEAEIVGRHSSLFYPPDAVAAGAPQDDLARAMNLGKIEQEQWRLRKDGSEFLAHVSMTALRGDDGLLRGFGKVVRDVTDQRAAEAASKKHAALLQSILSTVPDAMIVIDEEGLIISFSAAAESLFGYSEQEVVGSNVSRLMPSPDREQHDAYIARYLSTGERKIIGVGRIVVGARRDSSTFPMHLSIGEALGGGERVFTGFIRDLTERQRTQDQLEELQSELIHVARVSAMGTMASTLAHELNQPITAVANYVEAVRDLLVEPDAENLPTIREALGEAVSEAMRAGAIVRRLRDFVSRGEVERTVENVPALVSEAAALGLLGAREKGVAARFDLDPVASDVLVDKVQIQQVLINLIRNAIDAMSSSETRQLSVSTRTEGAGTVRVTVADTGAGVPAPIADQLFTAFVTTKTDGMGLGLSICRTIVEANGGRIWFEPREGGGSQFHFTLVRAEPENADGR